jgi:Domain of unknown function (DUF3883)
MPLQGWSVGEVQATVADYFEMLRAELSGDSYSKTAHRKRLIRRLEGRSDGAVERKHQNISAILLEEGLPAIDGYKPLGNYQGVLRDEVLESFGKDPELLRLIRLVETALPAGKSLWTPDEEDVFVPVPGRRDAPIAHRGKTDWRLAARHYDFEMRDREMRTVGRAGEEFVFRLEKSRLTKLGRPDLAKRVEWVADSVGEGAGFDVLSWDERERNRELFIEVKTTNFSRYQPFLISRNEVAFSSDHAENYSLYRIFNFRLQPKLFRLAGSVEETVRLDPCLFEARA